MNNNDVLRRLRYTLELEDAQMISIFDMGQCTVTRSEVSNWLKGEEDEDFEELADKQLALFLNGLIIFKRGKKEGPVPPPEDPLSNNAIFRKLRIAFDLKSDDIVSMFQSIDKQISPHELSAFFRKPSQSQYRVCNDQYLRNFLSALQTTYRPNDPPSTEA
jgi:uncharacterized protein YehS (DUF1456 family)